MCIISNRSSLPLQFFMAVIKMQVDRSSIKTPGSVLIPAPLLAAALCCFVRSLSSFSECRRALHVPLQLLTLERALSETFAEEILRSVSPSVAAVAGDRDDHFHILRVFGKDLLESIT